VMLCSLVDRYQCFRGICCLHLQGKRILSTLPLLAQRWRPQYHTTWHHIPEVCIHCHENLKSHIQTSSSLICLEEE
jgi:hypothetical protein